MADNYRIIGAEMSPYSVKARSYFRYKAIPHQWILRNAASQAEYEKHARMPIGDKLWTQKPQKYHARSLSMPRAKYTDVADKAALDPVLEAAGCLAGTARLRTSFQIREENAHGNA
jgi:hypothetical protein